MLNGRSQRGRPKGSGIDDTAILIDIAKRIEADPRIKPTTAIKAAGVSDPSVIRRLRDKLRHLEAEMRPQDSSAQCAVATPVPSPIESTAKTEPALACASGLAPDRLRQPSPPSTRPAADARADRLGLAEAARDPDTNDLLVAWMSLGLAAFNAVLQAQQVAAEQFFRMPPLSTLMRQHVALNESAMAFCAPKRYGRFAIN